MSENRDNARSPDGTLAGSLGTAAFRLDQFSPAQQAWDVCGHVLPVVLVAAGLAGLWASRRRARRLPPRQRTGIPLWALVLGLGLILCMIPFTEPAKSIRVVPGRCVIDYRYRASRVIPLGTITDVEYRVDQTDLGRRGVRRAHKLIITQGADKTVVTPLAVTGQSLRELQQAGEVLRAEMPRRRG